MQIKIEKNVAIRNSVRKGESKYPWKEMAAGDSFVVPMSTRQNLHYNAGYYGVKIMTRRESKDTVRMWRIA